MSMTEQFNVQPAPQRKVLGIEFGSTRIKAVLTDGYGAVLATGSHTWENQLVNGIWTYPLEQVWNGLQACYRDMADRYRMRYGSSITVLDAIGFSGMMHGYLAFDRDGNQLVPFRTWRNTITDRAADLLTKQFSFNIPQRWSIAHLYQAILNEEAHVSSIDYLTTLAGYVHWQLTGERVLGVGEASGMFPIDSAAMTYDADMADRFDRLVAGHHFRWKLLDILPRVLPAGVQAGRLTPEGAQLLDPTGELAARYTVLSAGRRRRNRHGRDKLGRRAHRQCIGRHLHFRNGRAGAPAQSGISGDRHGDDAGWQAGCHGALQQLHLGDQRMGRHASGVRTLHRKRSE